MHISQDDFNKLVTMIMLVYFMVMYSASFITGRHLDILDALSFLIPVITHTTHLIVGNQKGDTNT